MKYAVEIGSGTMIYISMSIKISSDTQKLIGRKNRQAASTRSHKSNFIFFCVKNKESRPRMNANH
jgi:hypothetical protein